jgi:hypothetical protein
MSIVVVVLVAAMASRADALRIVRHATASLTAAPCGQSYDPYDYTRSALSACGVPTVPLTRTQPLLGGGKAYIYEIDSNFSFAIPIPPPGFDIANATAAQLTEYDLPSRPSDPDQLAA